MRMEHSWNDNDRWKTELLGEKIELVSPGTGVSPSTSLFLV